MAWLSGGPELLENAAGYALAGAGLATPQMLPRPTPCPGWDLSALLDHLSDSIAALGETLGTAEAGAAPRPPGPGPGEGTGQELGADPGRAPEAGPGLGAGPGAALGGGGPAARLRCEAARLLGTPMAGPAGRVVAIGDRELTASIVTVTGAIEVAVHGWDIWAACGARRPVPARLAAVLLPAAVLLVTPATRPGLFAAPVQLPGPAAPGDQLVAFLGRHPHQ